ncbi:unnamed protein product [Coregonus sp. 'balchen']|nr:unnamed protein product [Coregonus sp. 'balchen']
MTSLSLEKFFILVETVESVQESEEERMVRTACQTEPWVPECPCAAVDKRSTGTITTELEAQLHSAHNHLYMTEPCPFPPQIMEELTD